MVSLFHFGGSIHEGVTWVLLTLGLTLEGATWDAESGKLVLNDGEAVHIESSQIRWVQDEEDRRGENLVTLPVYLNSDRSDVMFTVELPFEGGSAALVAMRAVCLNARG